MATAALTSTQPAPVERTARFEITGMRCAGCAGRVERALRAVPGVEGADVNLALDSAEVRMGEAVSPDGLIAAVTAIGFEARPLKGIHRASEEKHDATEARRDLWELGISALLTAPLVLQMLPMALGSGLHLPVWLELALAAPIQLWIARRFYAGAWKALRAGTGTMDQLVVMGTVAAFLYSLWLVLQNGEAAAGHLYFEASAVIVTLVLAGKVLEARAKRSASAALRELMALRPETAHLLKDGQEIDLPVEQVAEADLLLVRPGERLPVDGTIERGRSEIDESLVTGESMPVQRVPGETVVAGSVNGAGSLEIRALRVGENTTLSRIAELVEHAQSGKAPVQRLVDRISAVFVPAVIAIAAITFTLWMLTGAGFESAMVAAVSVLVIACPCALGLATPTALVAGTGAAARSGIIIRDIDVIERARLVDTVVFDKTGTLTHGRPALTDITPIGLEPDELLRLAASAQRDSEHPLGKAVVRAAEEHGLTLADIERFEAEVGLGIHAQVEGREIRIGRHDFVLGAGVEASRAAADETAEEAESAGKTVAWISIDGRPAGWMAFADALRDDAREAVSRLAAQSMHVILLTGDNKATAERIGRETGIETIHAAVRPAGKLSVIRELSEAGKRVAMVGDGVNDAPALAAADIGLAMGSGSDTALESAGITLMRPKPSLVAAAIDISRRTASRIRQNLFWAFVYNLVGIPVAALGYLSPAVAGTAMALSSVCVVTNSLLLKRWRAEEGA